MSMIVLMGVSLGALVLSRGLYLGAGFKERV
jgi:hypothetical protein